MAVVGAPQQVQLSRFRFYDAVAQAATEDKPQIQALEGVIFIVVEEVEKQARREVSVISPASSHGVGGGSRSSVGLFALGIDLIEIGGGFIGGSFASGVHRRGNVGRVGVSASQTYPQI